MCCFSCRMKAGGCRWDTRSKSFLLTAVHRPACKAGSLLDLFVKLVLFLACDAEGFGVLASRLYVNEPAAFGTISNHRLLCPLMCELSSRRPPNRFGHFGHWKYTLVVICRPRTRRARGIFACSTSRKDGI